MFDTIVLFETLNFWILYIVLCIPALILGFSEKRIAPWGTVVSLLLPFVVFHGTALYEFFAFLLWQFGVVFGFTFASARLKNAGKVRAEHALYVLAIVAAVLPLAIVRIGESSLVGINVGFLGISYIMFRVVQIVIEVHDGQITRITPWQFLYFMTFFATISSGPIDRSRRFVSDMQARRSRDEYASLVASGLLALAQGLIYKEYIGGFLYSYMKLVDYSTSFWAVTAYMYLYGFYLFFDFAGYSLMAIGTSRIFGIDTPINFNKPFLARDIKDFWQRWHMTLSFWFRDYIFSRFVMWALKKKIFKNRLQTGVAGYLLIMTTMGIWHGLDISHITYGIFHGILLGATEVYQKKSAFHKRNKKKKWYVALSTAITFQLVMFSLLIFSTHLENVVFRLLAAW